MYIDMSLSLNLVSQIMIMATANTQGTQLSFVQTLDSLWQTWLLHLL